VPAVVGANAILSVAFCPALSDRGKVAPETENPVPLAVTEFTVTAVVPVDDSVKVCVDDELTLTLPKARLEALRPRDAEATVPFSCSEYFLDLLPDLEDCVTVTA
jgi:hypothetical protein